MVLIRTGDVWLRASPINLKCIEKLGFAPFDRRANVSRRNEALIGPRHIWRPTLGGPSHNGISAFGRRRITRTPPLPVRTRKKVSRVAGEPSLVVQGNVFTDWRQRVSTVPIHLEMSDFEVVGTDQSVGLGRLVVEPETIDDEGSRRPVDHLI